MRPSHYFLDSAETSPVTTKEGELLRVALALNQGTSFEGLVDLLFETLDALIPYSRIGVAVLEPDGILRLAYVRSKLPILWGAGASAKLAGTSLEPIVREGRIRIINDLEAYFSDHPHSKTTPLLLKEGMRASLTLPLSTPQGVFGLMFFTSVEPDSYSPQHVDLLRSFAAGIGLAFERAKLVEALRASNEALKTLDQLKTNFLSNLSHELRTPLSEVLGTAYNLEDELSATLSPDQRNELETLIAGADRLRSLLNDLFDYTALEAGQIVLNKAPIALNELLREVLEEQRRVITLKGLDLTLDLTPQPITVIGDAPRLGQVFRALVDNAIKFTPFGGSVLIRSRSIGDEVQVDVLDSGRGIPLEYQDRVFEKFFQVESDPNRSHGGAGLGLALSRAIVVAHGGMLLLKSTPGVGSTLSVFLPLGEDQA